MYQANGNSAGWTGTADPPNSDVPIFQRMLVKPCLTLLSKGTITGYKATGFSKQVIQMVAMTAVDNEVWHGHDALFHEFKHLPVAPHGNPIKVKSQRIQIPGILRVLLRPTYVMGDMIANLRPLMNSRLASSSFSMMRWRFFFWPSKTS